MTLIDRTGANVPEYAKNLASPSVLINGRDCVALAGIEIPEGTAEGQGCRVYRDEQGRMSGMPSKSVLRKALANSGESGSAPAPFEATGPEAGSHSHERKGLDDNAKGAGNDSNAGVKRTGSDGNAGQKSAGSDGNAQTGKRTGLWAVFSLMAAMGAASLPALSCPICWPLYAGLLAAAGVSFVDYSPYLPFILSGALILSLIAFYYYGRTSAKWSIAGLGALASAVLIAGRFLGDAWYFLVPGMLLAAIPVVMILTGRLQTLKSAKASAVDCDC